MSYIVEDDYIGMTERAEAWIGEHFGKATRDAFFYTGDERQKRLKVIAEVSFLNFAIPTKPSTHIRNCLKPLFSDAAFRGKLLNAARHNMKQAHLVLPTLYATCKGMEKDQGYLDDLARLIEMMGHEGRELSTFREIDYLYNLWRLTGDAEYYTMICKVAERGCLSGSIEAYAFDVIDAYPVTHTIFYVTDFGRLPWPEHLASIKEIERILDMLSHTAEMELNNDLLAEYYISRRCLGRNTERARHELAVLKKAQLESGAWLAPGEHLRKKPTRDPIKYFFRNYHTTLVCAAAMRFAAEQEVFTANFAKLPPPKATLERLTIAAAMIKAPLPAEVSRIYFALGQGEPPNPDTEILLEGLVNPKYSLMTLSCLYRLSQAGALPSTLATAATEFRQIQPSMFADAPQILRFWALATEITPEPITPSNMAVIKDIEDQFGPDYFFEKEIPTEGVDVLIGLQLLGLSGLVAQPGASTDLFHALICKAIVTRDAMATIAMLPYLPPAFDADRKTAWRYALSMLPESLAVFWTHQQDDDDMHDQWLPQLIEAWMVMQDDFGTEDAARHADREH